MILEAFDLKSNFPQNAFARVFLFLTVAIETILTMNQLRINIIVVGGRGCAIRLATPARISQAATVWNALWL